MRHAVAPKDEELGHDDAFPRLSRDLLAVLEAAGERCTLTEGEVVSRVGDSLTSSAW